MRCLIPRVDDAMHAIMIRSAACAVAVLAAGPARAGGDAEIDWGASTDSWFAAELRKEVAGWAEPGEQTVPRSAVAAGTVPIRTTVLPRGTGSRVTRSR